MNIAFVLPGKDFTDNFLKSWTDVVMGCMREEIKFIYSIRYSAVIHEVRNYCMGGRTNKGRKQVPFEGFPYDYIMFLDHDQLFSFSQFKQLLIYDMDIMAGWYPMEYNGSIIFSSCGKWNGKGTFPLFTVEDMSKMDTRELITVDITGMGFTLVKKGVFENITYPWFYPTLEEIESTNNRAGYELDTIREDISFNEKVLRAGFDIWIDPGIRVGHDKRVTL